MELNQQHSYQSQAQRQYNTFYYGRQIKKHHLKTIVNCFGGFYSNLGSSLAEETSIRTYLNRIPNQLNRMALRQTTTSEINNLIKNLPNKTSHGHDNISNVMLKALRTSISFPLCHIFNQSLSEGIFPDRMKWAEVILLYKGKEMDIMINYQPVSLLYPNS